MQQLHLQVWQCKPNNSLLVWQHSFRNPCMSEAAEKAVILATSPAACEQLLPSMAASQHGLQPNVADSAASPVLQPNPVLAAAAAGYNIGANPVQFLQATLSSPSGLTSLLVSGLQPDLTPPTAKHQPVPQQRVLPLRHANEFLQDAVVAFTKQCQGSSAAAAVLSLMDLARGMHPNLWFGEPH